MGKGLGNRGAGLGRGGGKKEGKDRDMEDEFKQAYCQHN